MKLRIYRNRINGAVYKIEDKYYSFMHRPPENREEFYKEWSEEQAELLLSGRFSPVIGGCDWVKDFVCEIDL